MSDDDRKISVGLAPRARPRGAATSLNAAERAATAPDDATVMSGPPSAPSAVEAPPAVAPEPPVPSSPATKRTGQAVPKKSRATSGKVQVGVDVAIDTRGRARAAYRFTQFYERVPTFSEFVEKALEAEIRRIEERYNNGDRLDPETDNLPAGRPPAR